MEWTPTCWLVVHSQHTNTQHKHNKKMIKITSPPEHAQTIITGSWFSSYFCIQLFGWTVFFPPIKHPHTHCLSCVPVTSGGQASVYHSLRQPPASRNYRFMESDFFELYYVTVRSTCPPCVAVMVSVMRNWTEYWRRASYFVIISVIMG